MQFLLERGILWHLHGSTQMGGRCNLARDSSLQRDIRVQALFGDSDKAHP